MIHYKSKHQEFSSHDLQNQKLDFSQQMQSDKFFYILLLSIGLGGLYYVANSEYSAHNKSDAATIGVDYSISEIGDDIFRETPKDLQGAFIPKNTNRNALKISGYKEAREQLVFTIDSYDETAYYKLYPGNGEIIHLKNKHTYYEYDDPGTYNVKLEVAYDDYKSTVIFEEKLQIYNAIEVIGQQGEFHY